jgi:excisionase family DNA binding protein
LSEGPARTIRTLLKEVQMVATRDPIPAEEMRALLAKPVLTLDEAASIGNVHRNTVRNWIKAGRLHTVDLPGSTVRIPTSQLLALFEAVPG